MCAQDCMVNFPWVEKALRRFGAHMFESVMKPEHKGVTGEAAVEVRRSGLQGGRGHG